jgi:hypothetical protein
MTDTRAAFEYDVALSFAEADKEVAGDLAEQLRSRDITVFLDEYNSLAQWGKDILDHLVNLYARKALYCVLLISRHYPLRSWTEANRTSARELALRDADEYILPIRLDDNEIPGITEAKGYRDLRKDPIESIVTLLEEKLSEAKARSGPPSQSHDLRSGNVPHEET